MAVIEKDNFLSFLTKLEDDNTPLASSLQRQRMDLVQMQEQVLHLCQERDRIKLQLENHNKQFNIVKKKSGVIEKVPRLNYEHSKNLLEELLEIYALMGVKLCTSKKNNMLIKFTSNSGKFYRCTYFLEIHIDEGKIEIESYDLPPFIPLDKIFSKKSFNINDIYNIVKEVNEYLYAYSVRDLDICESKKLYAPDILTNLQYSLARELISFKLIKHDCALECKLSYLDLLAILPEEISVQSTDLALRYSNKWLHQFQEESAMSLVKLHLPAAINSILQQIENAASTFVTASNSSLEPSSSVESSEGNKTD